MHILFEEHDNPELLSGGGAATFIACSTCGVKIQGQNDGIVVFREDGEHRTTGEVMIIHKGRCETAQTQQLPWQDLDIFLRDIVLNTGVDLAQTEERISGPDGLASWGLHT